MVEPMRGDRLPAAVRVYPGERVKPVLEEAPKVHHAPVTQQVDSLAADPLEAQTAREIQPIAISKGGGGGAVGVLLGGAERAVGVVVGVAELERSAGAGVTDAVRRDGKQVAGDVAWFGGGSLRVAFPVGADG